MAAVIGGRAALASRRRPRRPPLDLCRALSSSSEHKGEEGASGEGGQEDKSKEDEEARLGGADFKVVAAGNQASHARRFNVSTGGSNQSRTPTLFKDYTRKRYTAQYERETEHNLLMLHMPKAVHDLEAEGAVWAKNPLIRDQHNVVIDKKAAEHRRWLGGEDESVVGGGNVFERKAKADQARLSGAQDAVLRKRAGLWSREGDMGVPEEGLGVEEKIQLALAQGDFDNLKGKGKPLQRLTEGQHFEDRASHLFMDALSKSGMKPVWVERSGRIKQMQALLIRRLTAEWGRRLLEACGEGGRRSLSEEEVREMRQRWEAQCEASSAVCGDLRFLNDAIDLYNIQVPSMTLQRLRLRLEHVMSAAEDQAKEAFLSLEEEGGQGGGRGWTVRTDAARAFVRQAEREGIMGPVTALGSLRLDEEGTWSSTTEPTARPAPAGQAGRAEAGGQQEAGSGVLGTLTSLFSSVLGGGSSSGGSGPSKQ